MVYRGIFSAAVRYKYIHPKSVMIANTQSNIAETVKYFVYTANSKYVSHFKRNVCAVLSVVSRFR